MNDTNPPSGNSSLIIVGLLGFAAALVTLLASVFTNNPQLIIPLLVLIALTAAMIALFANAWDRISDRLSYGLARRIVRRIDSPGRSKFRSAYLKYLYYSHRTFDIKGLTTQGIYALDLEQIFIDLSIAPDTKLPENPIPSELTTGGHSIWQYLTTSNVSKLVLIGAPGGGKTTLLKHVTLTLASDPKSRHDRKPDLLPILLFLREHVDAIVADPKLRLSEAISASLELMDEKPPDGWFEEYLDAGKCVVMLDGLDEVADAGKRHQVVAWVDLQMKVYGDCPFILTSRPHGYRSNPLSGVTQLVVRPFSREQVEQFVNNWYLANEIASYQKLDEGVQMAARTGARDLLKRIYAAHDIAELAVNPLLLTMIATLHKYRSSLPGRRVELYAEICEVLLGRKEQSSGLAIELTPAQKISVLQPLAFTMMERKTREIDLDEAAEVIAAPLKLVTSDMHPTDFLELVRNRSGILIEREQGSYAFSHKTFQEYLSAVYIQAEKMQDKLVASIDNPWWAETIRLYCARADATSIIEKCLSDVPPSIDRLTLAIECDYEALKLDPGVRERLRQIIDDDLDSEDIDRQHVAAEARLALRLKRLTRLDDTVYADMSDIAVTNAEFQLFLDTPTTKGGVPDHWMLPRFQPGTGKLPVVGVSPEQALRFCRWLTDRSTDIEVEYRLPNIDEGKFAGSYWVQERTSETPHFSLAGKQGVVSSWHDWLVAEDLSEAKLSGAQNETITIAGYWPHATVDAYAFTLAHARTQSLDKVLSRISNQARELDHDWGLELDRTLARAVDQVRNVAYLRTRLRANDLARSLAQMLNRKNAVASVRECAETLMRETTSRAANSLASALDEEGATNALGEFALAAEVARLIGGYSDLALIQEGLESGNVIALLTRVGALSAFRRDLIKSIELQYANTPTRISLPTRNENERQAWNNDLNAMKQAYTTLALLERRRTGQAQAYESLRFVREQKQAAP
ncbi:MAG: NACHT domain-containing protein [Chloroflexota bacterium]